MKKLIRSLFNELYSSGVLTVLLMMIIFSLLMFMSKVFDPHDIRHHEVIRMIGGLCMFAAAVVFMGIISYLWHG